MIDWTVPEGLSPAEHQQWLREKGAQSRRRDRSTDWPDGTSRHRGSTQLRDVVDRRGLHRRLPAASRLAGRAYGMIYAGRRLLAASPSSQRREATV